MRSLLKKVYLVLSDQERKKLLFLINLLILRTMFELAGIASVAPFLSAVGSSSITSENHPQLFQVFQFLEFSDLRSFQITLGFVSIIVLFVCSVFRALVDYFIYDFGNVCLHSIGLRLFSSYLRQPYSFFLNRNSSDLAKTMLSESNIAVNQVIMPTLHLASHLTLGLALTTMLFFWDPILATSLTVVLGSLYFSIYFFLRGHVGKLGKERRKANAMRFKVTSETFGGIKELKVLGRENAYRRFFIKPSMHFAYCQTMNQVFAQGPKYLVEAGAFSGVILIALYILTFKSSGLSDVLPMLGVYAFSGYRLLPAFQSIYHSFSAIKFGMTGLDEVLSDLGNSQDSIEPDIGNLSSKKLPLKKCIELVNVSFTYPGSLQPALSKINFKLLANNSLGIIGSTGSGKTTLADVILGLFVPEEGEILIDGIPLNEAKMREWQNSIGYVPQQIFLADESVKNNIAFGIPESLIDIHAVETAAKMAQIHDFIVGLPEGYDTHVGERGVRLSGGQRQRIGIARALYHNPDVILLDEATSALDGATESELMNAIERLEGQKTLIIIAHRLTTIQKCAMLIHLEAGVIKEIKGSNHGQKFP